MLQPIALVHIPGGMDQASDTRPSSTQRFRVVVLSGGGARGAYGAGVLIGLRELESVEQARPAAAPSSPVAHCYVGTSVGALNAAMAAQGQIDELADIYLKQATKERLLGKDSATVTGWTMLRKRNMDPFSYFDNAGVAELIKEHVRFDRLADAHLLITATKYQSGKLCTFYRSKLVAEFIHEETKMPEHKRRLDDYTAISNETQLHNVLLASAAIPFFYPQVEIDSAHYVDGGVGNNTPTRQAARFTRFLEAFGKGASEFTMCVVQDPVSFVIPVPLARDLSNVVQRTLDIFGNTLTNATLEAWERINREVDKAADNARRLQRSIDDDKDIPPAAKERLRNEITALFELTTALAPRVRQPLLVVRPSSNLESDGPLDFSLSKSAGLMRRGYEDFLNVAEGHELLSPGERKDLSAKTDLPFLREA